MAISTIGSVGQGDLNGVVVASFTTNGDAKKAVTLAAGTYIFTATGRTVSSAASTAVFSTYSGTTIYPIYSLVDDFSTSFNQNTYKFTLASAVDGVIITSWIGSITIAKIPAGTDTSAVIPGITYTTRLTPTTGSLSNIKAFSGYAVARYNGASPYWSTDGITWVSGISAGSITDVATNGSNVVVISTAAGTTTGPYVYYSSNMASGAAFTQTTAGWFGGTSTNVRWTGVTYAASKYIAGVSSGSSGSNTAGSLLYSANGIGFDFGVTAPKTLFYANNTFFLSASSNGFYTSTDSVTWTARTISTWATNTITLYARGVAYGAGVYVVAGQLSSTDQASFATSADLATWTSRTGPFTVSSTNVVYGIAHNGLSGASSLFVAICKVGTAFPAALSTDGITWTSGTSAGSGFTPAANGAFGSNAVSYGNSRFVFTDTTAKAYSSTNGATWTSTQLGAVAGTAQSPVAFGNGYFVAVNNNGAFRSTDGITWTTSSSSVTQSTNSTQLYFANGKFHFFWNGNGSLFGASLSTDGVTWTSAGVTATADTYPGNYPGQINGGLAYGNNRLVGLVANQGLSTLLANGQNAPGVNDNYWNLTNLSNGQVVAWSSGNVGPATTISISTDGFVWNQYTAPVAPIDFTYTSGLGYIILGPGRTVYASNNASTWTLKAGPLTISNWTNEYGKIVYGNGQYLITPFLSNVTTYSGWIISSDGTNWNHTGISGAGNSYFNAGLGFTYYNNYYVATNSNAIYTSPGTGSF